MREIKLVKFVSLSAMFLLIFAAMLSFSLAGVVNGESTSQVPPPEMVGSYSVGWIDTGIPKTGRGTLPVSIYYPSIIPGGGTDPNTTDAPYPTLLFSLGYRTTIDNYRDFASRIASWGFILTVVGSNPSALGSERATDLINALNWLDEQNDNSSFKLSQMMDESKFGALGHSLGGEATILASRSESRLKVLVPIAPFIVISPKSAADIHIPVLIVVGSGDTISPPNTMAYPLYKEGNTPKFCLTLVGDNHFSIIFTCSKYVISFLKFYLYEDQEYARYLYGMEAQQEIQNGKIKLMYDLRRIVEYEVLFKGVLYGVSVYSDSTFLNFFYNETLNEMDFTFTGPPYTTGTANISIPQQFAWGYDIEVYFDGESYPFTLSNNSISYFVYLAYNHSQHQLAINFVDLVPPILSITSPNANSLVNSSSVTVVWSGEDVASGMDYFEVKVDEESWINVENATSYAFNGLGDGSHVVHVKAFDEAGNTEEVSVSFIVDTTPPVVFIISPTVDSTVRSSNVTVSWSGSDNVSGIEHYEVELDDALWINVGTNASYIFVGLADGNHTLYVRAVDKAGNPTEAQVNFTVKTISNSTLLWMQWWFWTIVGVAVLFSLITVFRVRRRKLEHSVSPPPASPSTSLPPS